MPIQLPWRRLVPALLMSFSVAAPAAAAEAVALDAARLTAAGIELAPVQAAGAASLAHLPARVVVPSAQQRFVAAPVAGLVVAVLVGSGETVRAGQPLARIASPELLALRRDLTQAGAEQERARLALQRDQQLHAEGLIPAARLEATRAAAAQAGAALAERRALLGLSGGASEGGGELTIVAPIAGVVLAQPAQPGMRVEAAAPLFHIARLDPLALEVDLPPALAAQLKPGLRVRVPAGGAEGRVVAVGRAVSGAQTVTVRALLDRGLGALGPGQNVEVEIERGGDAAAGAGPVWAVPASALVRLGEDGGGSAVFVRRGDAFVPVPVSVLGEQGGNAVLRGELHADERVAVRGASLLKAAAMGIGKGE